MWLVQRDVLFKIIGRQIMKRDPHHLKLVCMKTRGRIEIIYIVLRIIVYTEVVANDRKNINELIDLCLPIATAKEASATVVYQ